TDWIWSDVAPMKFHRILLLAGLPLSMLKPAFWITGAVPVTLTITAEAAGAVKGNVGVPVNTLDATQNTFSPGSVPPNVTVLLAFVAGIALYAATAVDMACSLVEAAVKSIGCEAPLGGEPLT